MMNLRICTNQVRWTPTRRAYLAELHLATSGSNAPGVDLIIIDNEKLMLENYAAIFQPGQVLRRQEEALRMETYYAAKKERVSRKLATQCDYDHVTLLPLSSRAPSLTT
ncbi:uncharacterized protein LOC135352341 isoform X2 [Halichondria panicea]|uniref:uncharacterized protein LOC135352341 isoform X2 n=1 Tax=Halichondria panicea TaxID=6063 RepID=UPI00312BA9E6